MIDISKLISDLDTELINGYVARKDSGNYSLYCYTQKCVVDNHWNDTTLLARGLVVDHLENRIAAACMPKFFNLFERGVGIDDLPIEPFTCYEKLDGSLIHVWWDKYDNRWRATSKGSFESDQAKWAQAFIDKYLPENIDTNITLVCEAIYPENKIVVDYKGISRLYILTAFYNTNYREMHYNEYAWKYFSNNAYWGFVRDYNYNSIEDVCKDVAAFDKNKEGFVIRYRNGLRIKIKGEEYLRIHKALSNFTPLAIYEVLCECNSFDECRNKLRMDLPEEFWDELDKMLAAFEFLILPIINKFNSMRKMQPYIDYKTTKNRKEFAQYINIHIERQDQRSAYFMDFDGKIIKLGQWLKSFRPTGNILPGYNKTFRTE